MTLGILAGIVIILSVIGIWAFALRRTDIPEDLSHFDWAAYGRVETGEVEMRLTLEDRSKAPTPAVWALMEYKNIGKREMHLDRLQMGGTNNLFKDSFIVSLNDAKIEYTGATLSLPPSKVWYATLAPGKSYYSRVNILAYYHLQPGATGTLLVKHAPLAAGDAEVSASIIL